MPCLHPSQSLSALLAVVEETGGVRKLPTPRQLESSGVPIVARAELYDAEISVFQSGFAIYSAGGHRTVLRVDRCAGDFTYKKLVGPEEIVPADYFLAEPWPLRLSLAGEERIAYNMSAAQSDDGSDKWIRLQSSEVIRMAAATTPFENAENRLMLARAERTLSDRELEAVRLYYCEGLTQREIAEELQVQEGTVRTYLKRALAKLRAEVGL